MQGKVDIASCLMLFKVLACIRLVELVDHSRSPDELASRFNIRVNFSSIYLVVLGGEWRALQRVNVGQICSSMVFRKMLDTASMNKMLDDPVCRASFILFSLSLWPNIEKPWFLFQL